MVTKTDLLALGLPPYITDLLAFDPQVAVVAQGTDQATATKILTSSALVSGTGGVLLAHRGRNVVQVAPAAVTRDVAKGRTAGTVTIYPPVGRSFLGLAHNAGFVASPGDIIVTEDAGTDGIVLLETGPAAGNGGGGVLPVPVPPVPSTPPTDYFLNSAGQWAVPDTNFVTVTTGDPYTVQPTDDTIWFNPSDGTVSPVLNLPPLASVPPGKTINVILNMSAWNSGWVPIGNTFTVNSAGSDRFDAFVYNQNAHLSGYISVNPTFVFPWPINALQFQFVSAGNRWYMFNTGGSTTGITSGGTSYFMPGKAAPFNIERPLGNPYGLVPTPQAGSPSDTMLQANGTWGYPVGNLVSLTATQSYTVQPSDGIVMMSAGAITTAVTYTLPNPTTVPLGKVIRVFVNFVTAPGALTIAMAGNQSFWHQRAVDGNWMGSPTITVAPASGSRAVELEFINTNAAGGWGWVVNNVGVPLPVTYGTFGAVTLPGSSVVPYSGPTPPPNGKLGDLWYSTDTGILSVLYEPGGATWPARWIGTNNDWRTSSNGQLYIFAMPRIVQNNAEIPQWGTGIAGDTRAIAVPIGAWVGTPAEVNPNRLAEFKGILWFNTTTNQLSLYDGTVWRTIAPPQLTVTQQVFTASGTYTPSPGLQYATVELQAAGGGGQPATPDGTNYIGAFGGGAGVYMRGVLTAAQIGASRVVTVGQAGRGLTDAQKQTSFGASWVQGGFEGGDGGAGGWQGTWEGVALAASFDVATRSAIITPTAVPGVLLVPGGSGGMSMAFINQMTYPPVSSYSGLSPQTVAFPAVGQIAYMMGPGGESYFASNGESLILVPPASPNQAMFISGNIGSGGSSAMAFPNHTVGTQRNGGMGGPGICIVTEFCLQ